MENRHDKPRKQVLQFFGRGGVVAQTRGAPISHTHRELAHDYVFKLVLFVYLMAISMNAFRYMSCACLRISVAAEI